MMKTVRGLLAALLTAAVMLCGTVAVGAYAAAKNVTDDIVTMKELETVSLTAAPEIIFGPSKEVKCFKIEVPREGTVTLKAATTYCAWFDFINSSEETLKSANNLKNFTVDVPEKGTYYLKVCGNVAGVTAKVTDMFYTFTPSEKPVISLAVSLKKGDAIQFDAVTENYDGKVTWSSTKKSVAAVSSKGLVTAKKAGTTYIRAKMDNGDYVEIKVVVKKK